MKCRKQRVFWCLRALLRVKGLLAILNLLGSGVLKLEIISTGNVSLQRWLKQFSASGVPPFMWNCFFLPLFYPFPSVSTSSSFFKLGLWWSFPPGVSLCLKRIKPLFSIFWINGLSGAGVVCPGSSWSGRNQHSKNHGTQILENMWQTWKNMVSGPVEGLTKNGKSTEKQNS